MKFRLLPALLASAFAIVGGPAAAQSGRYVTPPPVVLSPNLTEPWVMQLTPGRTPIYAPATVSKPRKPAVIPPTSAAQPAALTTPATVGRPAAVARAVDPEFLPTEVAYDGTEKPGTIVIDTNTRHLFLVQDGGKAMRYGVGVGRPGFEWAGVHTVTRKAEWPDWHPPVEMRKRQPNLPLMMPGGPKNPLGARAMYLGSTLYRIHGTAEPWTIGHAVSSGCIRMRNEDVIDLYSRVKVGTRVIVL